MSKKSDKPKQNFTHPYESPVVQRKLQTSLVNSTTTADRNKFNAASALPGDVQSKMEQSFLHDFSDVNFIKDSGKATSLNAQAFAQGNEVHFAPGKFQPHSRQGQELIGHELAHVVQQRQNKVAGSTSHKAVDINEDISLEQEADNVGKKAADGQTVHSLHNISSGYIQKKDELDVEAAIRYYSTKQGKKNVYSDELALDLYKAAGTSAKALYTQAVAEKKTGESFVKLVAAAQTSLGVESDGKCGPITKAALDVFRSGGEHGIDYSKLFADKKLEIGIAVGQQFTWEAEAIKEYLKKERFALKSESDSKNVYSAKKIYKAPGDKTAPDVEIEVIVDLTWEEKAKAKDAYSGFLSQKEVAIYSGHARYGTGPDFDSKDKTDGNFKIGKGYDKHMNDILKKNPNDLKGMSKAGKFDLDAYQVWMFNACSSDNFLSEIRSGHVTGKAGGKTRNKSKNNLRFFGTKLPVETDALPLLKAVIEMKSMKEIIEIMNQSEKDKGGKKGKYFMAD